MAQVFFKMDENQRWYFQFYAYSNQLFNRDSEICVDYNVVLSGSKWNVWLVGI